MLYVYISGGFASVVPQGLLLSGFVMACELFAAKNRTFAGIMIENFWSIATCLLALLAYLIRDWVYLQLCISLFGLLTIPLFWYVVLYSKPIIASAKAVMYLFPIVCQSMICL